MVADAGEQRSIERSRSENKICRGQLEPDASVHGPSNDGDIRRRSICLASGRSKQPRCSGWASSIFHPGREQWKVFHPAARVSDSSARKDRVSVVSRRRRLSAPAPRSPLQLKTEWSHKRDGLDEERNSSRSRCARRPGLCRITLCSSIRLSRTARYPSFCSSGKSMATCSAPSRR
jgi:hypothetical protein